MSRFLQRERTEIRDRNPCNSCSCDRDGPVRSTAVVRNDRESCRRLDYRSGAVAVGPRIGTQAATDAKPRSDAPVTAGPQRT